LVLPETTKDAPGSYGGKLEQKGVFKKFSNDVLAKLKKEKAIPKNCKTGNIILVGHSGAYRVMAHILHNGDLHIKEVILLDAVF
jgi:hypothetical protein